MLASQRKRVRVGQVAPSNQTESASQATGVRAKRESASQSRQSEFASHSQLVRLSQSVGRSSQSVRVSQGQSESVRVSRSESVRVSQSQSESAR
eukprot:291774-Lingulodinium_polyedra.AAC.1